MKIGRYDCASEWKEYFKFLCVVAIFVIYIAKLGRLLSEDVHAVHWVDFSRNSFDGNSLINKPKMPPKTNSGASKKVEMKKKEKIIEVSWVYI